MGAKFGRARRTKFEIASQRAVQEVRPQSAQVNALNGLSHASWQKETGRSADLSAALRLHPSSDFHLLSRGRFGVTADLGCAIYCWCNYRFVSPLGDFEIKTFPRSTLTDLSIQCPNCRRMLFCDGYAAEMGKR